MKLRTDVVILYKDLHSWAGILCGLFLFTAFYAGAITMFEAPLERWLTPRVTLPSAPPLSETPGLVKATFKAHPEAKKEFILHLTPDGPARMVYVVRDPKEKRDHNHDSAKRFGASFDSSGRLVVAAVTSSATAQFVDTIHQQAGLPFEHDTAMIIVGIICLLYALALVSGVVVLLPSLVKDLFALRLHKAFKRRWLDIHNVLGLFSLPFHIVMALTSLVFAFHDVFYDAQDAVLHGGKLQTLWDRPRLASAPPGTALLSPEQLIAKLRDTAPGFEPVRLEYRAIKGGTLALNVWGRDGRYGLRSPTEGFAGINPYTGAILQKDYLPGHQSASFATVTAFFALHFGNFGGLAVRWSYVLLGLAGAFLIYTGNLLWLEGRKRRNGGIEKPTTRALGGLTIGWTLGTVTGLSVVLGAAKLMGPAFGEAHAMMVFYATLAGAIGWAWWWGRQRAKDHLLWLATATTLAIPIVFCLT